MNIKLFTDGACSGNPGRGGWAAIAFNEAGDNIMHQGGGFRLTTNNRMEILAVAMGLRLLHGQTRGKETDIKVTVFSDSQLVVSTMNSGWAKKNNQDLWKQLDESVALFGKVEFVKVKGHAGNKGNVLADETAVAWSQPERATEVDAYYEKIAGNARIAMTGEPVVREVRLLGVDTPDDRKIKVLLSNGNTVTITGLDGGFAQCGGDNTDMRVTVDIAWRYVKFLNGKAL